MILNARRRAGCHQQERFHQLIGIDLMAFDHPAIERGWHPADDRVEDLLNSFIFKGGSAQDRIESYW